MNIADAKQQVKNTVQAYLAKDETGMYRIPPVHQRPVFLVGAPGIGKTAIMSQIAEELGIGLVSYSMTHHTRQSALGLPFIVHHQYDGMDIDVSEYTMSEIIASIYDYMDSTGLDKGILFLDEINCVSETLYPSMLQFLQFKTFGRHKVPDNWVIVCAGNPPAYNKSVHEFDIVTLDRLRKIDVEPDFQAWKSYARAVGVHPAVMSYLEVRPQDFYTVEATPSGKSFVTARGWDDLSETVSLFEEMKFPIDKALVIQYLQNDEIAQRFATYYDLFDKYRSDYQVDQIMAGKAPAEIVRRAQEARFDERLAVLSLLLDGLETSMRAALLQEEAVLDARDALRQVKPGLLGGASAQETLGSLIEDRRRELQSLLVAETLSPEAERRQRTGLNMLQRFAAECQLSGKASGAEAFEAIQGEYKGEVVKIDTLAAESGAALDNAFAFVEEAFGDGKEMLVFVTELTARGAASHFISRFGSESYYAHNQELMVDQRQDDLAKMADQLEDELLGTADARREDASESVGGAAGAAPESAVAPAPEAPAPDAPAAPEAPASDAAPATTAPEVPAPAADLQQLKAYYEALPRDNTFAALCRMVLPDGLEGKNVLDVCCRRGRGVYKLSARVGAAGTAMGIDPSEEAIEDAWAHVESACKKSHLDQSNMNFAVGYPEDLAAAGVATGSMDMVYVNTFVNVAYDRDRALREFNRVLVPGGELVLDAVLASGPRDQSVVERARELGNVIQAAPSPGEMRTALDAAGFVEIDMATEFMVDASQGCEPQYVMPTAESDEDVRFVKVRISAKKPRA